MLSKKDHIHFWKKTGEDSWETAEYLMAGNKNVEALFMFCLSLEKFLKGNWVNDNIDNYPPRIHDLRTLLSETDVQLDVDLSDFLDTVNRWNIEGRYPDYRFTLSKIATNEYVTKQYNKMKMIKTCLLEGI